MNINSFYWNGQRDLYYELESNIENYWNNQSDEVYDDYNNEINIENIINKLSKLEIAIL